MRRNTYFCLRSIAAQVQSLKSWLQLLCAGMAQMSVAGTEQSTAEGQDADADSAKRLRNLQKKLRQVQQLKERQAKGESLEPEQIAKIGSEAGILAEIQGLGG